MADLIVYGVAETGTWQTGSPNPHINLDGGVPAGLSIRQSFAEALTSGNFITVTVRKDVDNWSCYGYKSGDVGTSGPEFTSGSPDTLDFSAANLLDSNGTLADGDLIEVWVELPESEPFTGESDPIFTSSPAAAVKDDGVATEYLNGTGAYSTPSAGGGWVDGATVGHNVNDSQIGTVGTYAHVSNQTVVVDLDQSGTLNFTGTPTGTETLTFDVLLNINGAFIPTIQVNGGAPTKSSTAPTFNSGSSYKMSVFITATASYVEYGGEMT